MNSTPDSAAAQSPESTSSPTQEATQRPRRTRGLRLVEKFLPLFGPAQVGDSKRPIRPPSQAEQERQDSLTATLERKVAPDGTVYLVEREPEE